MKIFKFLVSALIVTGIVGCASQADKTHQVFVRQDAEYHMLVESLEDLKIAIEEGGGHEQYKAVIALRHLSKHIEEPGKKDLAVRGLAALVAFGSDNQITKRAESRLEWLYEEGSPHLQLAVIQAQRDLVTGDLGITKKQTSFFSDHTDLEFILASDGAREDALDFLVDQWDDGNEFQQYHTAAAFGLILANPKRCREWIDADRPKEEVAEETDGEVKLADATGGTPPAPKRVVEEAQITASGFFCDEWDDEDQSDWKQELMEEIGDILEDNKLSPEIAAKLILALDAAQGFENPTIKINTLQGMINDEDMPEDTMPLVEAVLDKAKHYHPDIFTSAFKVSADAKRKKEKTNLSSSMDATTQARMLAQERQFEAVSTTIRLQTNSFARNTQLASLSRHSQRRFWFNNAEQIIENQLFAPSGKGKSIPVGWLFYPGYDGSPESNQLKEILYHYSLNSLEKGYRITGAKSLVGLLNQSLKFDDKVTTLDITRRLKLIEYSYPTLKRQGAYPASLITRLGKEAVTREDVYEKRLFFVALAASIEHFGKPAEKRVCKLMPQMDVYAQHLAAQKVRGAQGRENPFLTPEGKVNQTVKPGTIGPTFCERPLYYHPAPLLAVKAATPAPKIIKTPPKVSDKLPAKSPAPAKDAPKTQGAKP